MVRLTVDRMHDCEGHGQSLRDHRPCLRGSSCRPRFYTQADIARMGLVLWEIITREAPAEEQLRELRTPAECPEVRSSGALLCPPHWKHQAQISLLGAGNVVVKVCKKGHRFGRRMATIMRNQPFEA